MKRKNIDRITHVGKANPYHDSLGRFTTGGGGGGGPKGSDVRNFGVPGKSGSYKMNAKEKKLAQQIIDNEDLDLKIKDSTDALGNSVTDIHGTREDYETFKGVWNMVAPSTVGKSIDRIQEVTKANPYHDSRGRFTTASGGGGGASAGGGMSNAERVAQERFGMSMKEVHDAVANDPEALKIANEMMNSQIELGAAGGKGMTFDEVAVAAYMSVKRK